METGTGGKLLIKTWKVHGTNDDDGGKEVATIVLRENAEWAGPAEITEYRYHTFYFVDDPEDEVDFEGHDDAAEADARFHQLRADLTREYLERSEFRRKLRSRDLMDLCVDWADGPERQIVEAVATLIEKDLVRTVLYHVLHEAKLAVGPDKWS